MVEDGWLPPLIPVDWNRYLDTIDLAYAIFQRDFGESRTRPTFQGRRLGLKRHPELDGKSATFWHFVTEGADESHRTPQRERLERIGWPRALIEEANQSAPRVRVWPSLRPGTRRWLIALDDFSYLVVLEDRGDFLLPWTAYWVAEDHRRRKLQREFEAWQAGREKS